MVCDVSFGILLEIAKLDDKRWALHAEEVLAFHFRRTSPTEVDLIDARSVDQVHSVLYDLCRHIGQERIQDGDKFLLLGSIEIFGGDPHLGVQMGLRFPRPLNIVWALFVVDGFGQLIFTQTLEKREACVLLGSQQSLAFLELDRATGFSNVGRFKVFPKSCWINTEELRSRIDDCSFVERIVER